MTQDEVDGIWNQMTQQEKSIYEDRMKDPKWMDATLTEGMAPVDRMFAAVQTANAINTRKGLSLNKSNTSTYSDEPIDFKKMAKVIGSALTFGIPGFLTAAKVGELGIDSEEVLAAAKELVLSGIGQGSGRKGDNSTQPPASTPTEYNQDYWKENFYDKGLGKDSAAIAAEQLRIAEETGMNAYGNDLTAEQIKAVNKAAREKDLADKAARTIADREAEALDNQNRADARANRAAAVKKAKADIAAKKLADEIALTNQENQRGSFTPTPPPAPTGNGGDKTPAPSAPAKGSTARSNRGQGRKGRQADASNASNAATAATNVGGIFDYNMGGLATKKKPAVKKMRNDPTAGLASKKKAKQKAQAKKGALAAKRT